MKQKTAGVLRWIGIGCYCAAVVQWISILVLFFLGHDVTTAFVDPLLFALGGHLIYKGATKSLDRVKHAKEIESPKPAAAESSKIEPFTRAPERNQCPVCGLDDLENWRLFDRHLQLIGEDKFVQKWGDHDAHWSCIVTCPYVPTKEELDKKAHDGGEHPDHVEGCKQCAKRKRRKEIEREDWEIPGCYCRQCMSRNYDAYRFRYGYGYEVDYRSLEHVVDTGPRAKYMHYRKMADASNDPDVKAYAYEKMIEIEESAK